VLTFCVRLPNDDAVIQETPTLLSGLTVKVSASCCTAGLVVTALCPDGPIEENMANSIRPEARKRAVLRDEAFNDVTKREREVSTVKGYATVSALNTRFRFPGFLCLVRQYQDLALSDSTKASASAGPSCLTPFT
jgi:hypothetical protein